MADGGSINAEDSDVAVDQSDQSDNNDADNGAIVANDESDVDVAQTTITDDDNTTTTNTTTNTSTDDDVNTLTIGDVTIDLTEQLNEASLTATVTGNGFIAAGGADGTESDILEDITVTTGSISGDISNNRGVFSASNNTGVANIQTNQQINVGTATNGIN